MKLRHATTAIVILLFMQINGQELTTCGERLVNHEALITNGLLSNGGDWPWHAAIYFISNTDSSYKCGGTLLSPDSILTAAHCVPQGIRPEKLLIYLGTHNLKAAGSSLQTFQAYNIFRHRDFDEDKHFNDIAIIRLSTEATLNNYVQPICLWDSNRLELSEVLGKLGTVIGWGFTETDQQSHILRHAFMPVVAPIKCLDTYRDFFGARLSEKNYCAGFRNGTSVCNGDSGGSMTFEENGVYYIRGIVSVNPARAENSNLCDPKHLVLFTDVAQYLPWIEEIVPQVKRIAPRTRTRPQSRSGENVCNGDSGGSMSFEQNGRYYIRGIVSLTSSRKDKESCNSKDYVVFTDVVQYLPWIEEEVPQPRPQHRPQHRHQYRPQLVTRLQPTPPIQMDFTSVPNQLSCSHDADFSFSNSIMKEHYRGLSIQPFMNHHYTSFGRRRKRNVGLEQCCNRCKYSNECRRYEWSDENGGTCRLKSGNGDTIGNTAGGSISGQSPSGRSSSIRSSYAYARSSSTGSGTSHNAHSFSGSNHIERGNGNSGGGAAKECWWSGCQPYSWAERGCYPSDQWRQYSIRDCTNGNEYYCCSTGGSG